MSNDLFIQLLLFTWTIHTAHTHKFENRISQYNSVLRSCAVYLKRYSVYSYLYIILWHSFWICIFYSTCQFCRTRELYASFFEVMLSELQVNKWFAISKIIFRKKRYKVLCSRQKQPWVGVSLLEVRKTNTQSHPTPRLVEKSVIAEVYTKTRQYCYFSYKHKWRRRVPYWC